MSNALRNKMIMDYFKGIKDAIETLTMAFIFRIDRKLTEADYRHILEVVEKG